MYMIKTLGIESVEPIIAFDRLCFSEADQWKEADWHELLEDDRAVYYALMDGEKLIGDVFIYNWKGEHDYVKIMNVAIHPDYRNQGGAGLLMNHVTEEMKQIGMYRFCGETRSSNRAMQKVFEKSGYNLDRVEEHYFHDPEESAWKYVLQL